MLVAEESPCALVVLNAVDAGALPRMETKGGVVFDL